MMKNAYGCDYDQGGVGDGDDEDDGVGSGGGGGGVVVMRLQLPRMVMQRNCAMIDLQKDGVIKRMKTAYLDIVFT